MNKREAAARAKAILEDEIFKAALERIREEQVNVFLKPSATQAAREDAHVMVRALAKLEHQLTRAISDAEFEKRKEQNGRQ